MDRSRRKKYFYAQSNPKRDSYKALNYYGTPPPSQDAALPFGQAQELNPDNRPGKNVSVIGAWTQGKLVVLDNSLNSSDIGGRHANSTLDKHYEYDMAFFSDKTVTRIRPQGSFSLFSFENVFNYYDALSPDLPFDVVWRVASSRNQSNSEVVFDEYLMNNAFVVAHMNATTDLHNEVPKDGFVSTCTRGLSSCLLQVHEQPAATKRLDCAQFLFESRANSPERASTAWRRSYRADGPRRSFRQRRISRRHE